MLSKDMLNKIQTNNKPVIFYGAGNYATKFFQELSKYVSPVCFCDSDKKKHGKTFMNLPVLSLQDVFKAHADFWVYITTPEIIKIEIIAILLKSGIAQERILNYEPFKKYLSCKFLESNFLISREGLQFCYPGCGRSKSPIVLWTDDYAKTIERFIAVHDAIIEQLNDSQTGDAENGTAAPCIGCPQLSDEYWLEQRRIRLLHFSHFSSCQFKCVYCSAGNVVTEQAGISTKFPEFFRFLQEQNFIDEEATEIHIASGEIAIHPDRDRILSAIENFACIFFTNAVAYNQKIAQILSKELSKLLVSVDAGTAETFAKIKGVDAFYHVVENLKHYAENGIVMLKYIVLPNINDNFKDVDGFIGLCKQLGVKTFDVSRNHYDMGGLNDTAIEAVVRLINKGHENGMTVHVLQEMFDKKEYGSITARLTEIKDGF